jgi:hypothetical protein
MNKIQGKFKQHIANESSENVGKLKYYATTPTDENCINE